MLKRGGNEGLLQGFEFLILAALKTNLEIPPTLPWKEPTKQPTTTKPWKTKPTTTTPRKTIPNTKPRRTATPTARNRLRNRYRPRRNALEEKTDTTVVVAGSSSGPVVALAVGNDAMEAIVVVVPGSSSGPVVAPVGAIYLDDVMDMKLKVIVLFYSLLKLFFISH